MRHGRLVTPEPLHSPLARLFEPLDIRQVIAALDDGEVRHLPSADPGRFHGLMTWDVAVQVIQLHMDDATRLRVYQNGARVPADMLKPDRTATSASAASLRRLIRQGVSLVMSDVAASSPALQQLAYEAERWFGCSLTLGMIATFGKGHALNPHFDNVDVLALQIEGEKTWRTLGERCERPNWEDDLPVPEAVTREIVLRPGHALLLPHGTWHRCWSDTDTLQLSILVARNRGHQILDWLLRRHRDDAALFAAAPLARDDTAAVAAYEARWKAQAHQLIDSMSLGEFLADGDRLVPAPAHLDLAGRAMPGDPDALVSLLVRRPIAPPAAPGEPLRMAGAKLAPTPAILRVVELLNAAVTLPMAALERRLAPEFEPDAVIRAVTALDAAGLVSLRRA
jgi:hypothetical protein